MATEQKKSGNGGQVTKAAEKPLQNLPAAQGTAVAPAREMSATESIIEARRQLDAADEAEGFIRVNPLDGVRIFYTVVEGSTLRGIVLGRFEKDGAYKTNADGELNYWYQIQLTAPFNDCVVGKGDERESYAAQIGDIVIVDERSAMKCIGPVLQRLQEQGKKLEVLLRAVSKATTSRGRRVWNFDIKGRIIAPAEKINALPVGRGAVSDGGKLLPANV